MNRRVFLRNCATGAMTLACAPVLAAAPARHDFVRVAEPLLRDWCDALLRLQVNEPGNPKEHGRFRCPACSEPHGRVADAVYPLLHLAHRTGEQRYLDAALRVMEWSRNVDSPDGAWTNDLSPKSWKGITVFGAIALAEALQYHGTLLDAGTREAWRTRLRRAGDYIFKNFTFATGNINYPVTAAYGLALLSRVLDVPEYRERAREFAHGSLSYFTPNKLLFGEGSPASQRSPKNCLPVDLGYNVEESLQALALYGLLEKDETVLRHATDSLAAHLAFMLPDGGWDNSFGTRSYKWTYWGSRTSDGCAPAYVLLADRHPAFLTAAVRNTELLRACTQNGLLHGGPHYATLGAPPCVHHTFCHAKSLAAVLDHHDLPRARTAPLPRERARGVTAFPEIATRLVAIGPWRATITDYDWFYRGQRLHPTGGVLSMLYHLDLGPIFSGSMNRYALLESHNMQPNPGPEDVVLTPRLELRRDNDWFSQIFNASATCAHQEQDGRILVTANTRLVNEQGKHPEAGEVAGRMTYTFSRRALEIEAVNHSREEAMHLVLPFIVNAGEEVRLLKLGGAQVKRRGGSLRVHSTEPLELMQSAPTLNLVPGFGAMTLRCTVPRKGRATVKISA